MVCGELIYLYFFKKYWYMGNRNKLKYESPETCNLGLLTEYVLAGSEEVINNITMAVPFDEEGMDW